MWSVNKYLMLTFLFIGSLAFAQTSKSLKKEQEKILQKIAETKALLGNTQEGTKLAADELSILQSRIELRQELVYNVNRQLNKLEAEIRANKATQQALSEKSERLKDQFKKLVRAAYKYRNKYDNIIYIFSAEDFNEANKRMKYVEKLKDFRIKQVAAIKRNQEELDVINKQLEDKIAEQKLLIEEQEQSRKDIIADQLLKKKAYDELKSQESNLMAQLKTQEEQQRQLDAAIEKALKAELEKELARARKEEERRRKAAEAAEKKRLAELAKAKESETPAKPKEVVAPAKKPVKTDFTVTKEVALTGANFAANKGKLPWPVAKGTVTKKFGKHAHPVHVGVYTNNNGVDISTNKGATVRSIYTGEVTSVLVIPGAGKVVIIAHGNYRTVYSNLKEAYVQKGDKVSTKQKVGSLLPSSSGKTSTAHFEIHVIKDGAVSKLNPSLWIAK